MDLQNGAAGVVIGSAIGVLGFGVYSSQIVGVDAFLFFAGVVNTEIAAKQISLEISTDQDRRTAKQIGIQQTLNDYNKYAANIVGQIRAKYPDIPGLAEIPIAVFNGLTDAYRKRLQAISMNLPDDPAVPATLIDSDAMPYSQPDVGYGDPIVAANAASGPVSGTGNVAAVTFDGVSQAAWSSAAGGSLPLTSLESASATVIGPGNVTVGSGDVSFTSADAVDASLAGSVDYDITGSGSAAVYPQGSSLASGASWQNYSASLSGSLSIQIATDSLELNGTVLPAGTYTIETSAATAMGSGTTPFADATSQVTLGLTSSQVATGPGSGSFSVGGSACTLATGLTLAGYSGSATITPNGATETLALGGTAANVVQLAASAAGPANQNSPVGINYAITTSLADTYNLTALVPQGWTVIVDPSQQITVQPPAGTQSGTYPVQLVLQSLSDPDLETQTTVMVPVAPTTPGLSLAVTQDQDYYLPSGRAEIPTAFDATIQNLGPAADTYNLAFSNVPAGFAVQTSVPSITIPAGQTGLVGVYLVPSGTLPPAGTDLSFAVTATSQTDTSLTQTQSVSFAMPAVAGLTLSANPASVSRAARHPDQRFAYHHQLRQRAGKRHVRHGNEHGLDRRWLDERFAEPRPNQHPNALVLPRRRDAAQHVACGHDHGQFRRPGSADAHDSGVHRAPGVQAIVAAAGTAGQIGDTDLATQLNNVGIALNELSQNLGDPIAKSQALAALAQPALSSVMADDPLVQNYLGPLQMAAAHWRRQRPPPRIRRRSPRSAMHSTPSPQLSAHWHRATCK